MGFSLEADEQLLKSEVMRDILRRFSPFLKEDGILPFCHVFFHIYDGRYDNAVLLGEINGFRFLQTADGMLVTDGTCWAHCIEGGKRIEAYVSKGFQELPCVTVLLHAYQYSLLLAGGLLLHAACVVYKGEGLAFCGVPGAGKSTQAHLWQKYLSASPLNNDQPALLFSNGRVYVSGSPWSGKEPCYKNESAPLRALVFVEQAKENRTAPLTQAQAYSRLYLNNFVFPFSEKIEEQYRLVVERLVKAVPVYSLSCTISKAAVMALADVLSAERNHNEVKPMKYKANSNFILKNVSGDWLLLPRGSFSIDYSAVIVFNDAGVFLWNCLQEPCTEEELADSLAAHFEIPMQTAVADTAAYIQKMKESQLLEEG